MQLGGIAEGMENLAQRVQALEREKSLPGNRLFYLATDPEFFLPIVEGIAGVDRERRAERVRPERTTTAYRGLELVVVDAAERVVQEIADAVLADLEDPLAGDWQGRERAFVDVACG